MSQQRIGKNKHSSIDTTQPTTENQSNSEHNDYNSEVDDNTIRVQWT